MRKKDVKRVVLKAMTAYYDSGFTNTAARVYRDIIKGLDEVHGKRHKVRNK